MGIYFEDYEALDAGHRWTSPGRTVTESDIVTFAGMTGDFHPLHTDAHAARQSPYGERIAHGHLTAAIAAGLAYRVGLDEGTAFAVLSTTWRFTLPVMIGDTIRVAVVLVEARASRKHPSHGVVLRKYEVRNQRDLVVALCDIAILCMRKPQLQRAVDG